jgi:hypothetical protein
MPSVRPTAKAKIHNNISTKKNYYQLERDKQDLTLQIEETI